MIKVDELDIEVGRHDASSANIVFFDEINDEGVPMTADEISQFKKLLFSVYADSFTTFSSAKFLAGSISKNITDRQRQMQRELGKLQFINPGGSMSQPIKSRRSRRKINGLCV